MVIDSKVCDFVGFPYLGCPQIVLRPKESRGSCSSVMVLFVLIVVQILFLPFCHVEAACNQVDHDSLLPFFSNISASTPLNWSPSIDCCLWEGVQCDVISDRVTRLWLPYRGLNGILSPSIANLARLSRLNLSHNTLSGSLPNGFFSSLSTLQVLDLSNNLLNGEIPYSVYSNDTISGIQTVDLSSNRFNGGIPFNSILQVAGNLSAFNVSNNSFTGQIPSNICTVSFSSLTVLDFSYNDFSGYIPSGIGRCTKLKIFSAGFNNLSGTIPDDIYESVSLEQLSLPLNMLSGSISDSLVNLVNLKILDLYSNRLIGPIPRDIGKLSQLEQLQLHINNLTGTIPQSLMNCTKLVTLNLRVNLLQGKLEDFDFSKFSNLKILDIGNNNFTGNLPRTLYACKSLKAVRLAYNRLEGQISPEIQSLKSLSFLSVSSNNLTNLTGAIQIMMGCKNLTTLILSINFMNESIPDKDLINSNGFQNLQVLSLGASGLSGQIPSWLAKLENLEVLDLSVNRITGEIPSWLGKMPSLFYIDLSSNFLSGGFPKELAEVPTLALHGTSELVGRSYLPLPVFAQPNNATYQQYNQLSNLPPAIYLVNNNLSGGIPREIRQLKFVHVLDLSNNNFSGEIPDEISNLSNLEKLDLSGNRLSGEIPASLRVLHFLSSFSVSDNNLQGSIPTGGQFDTFPVASFTGNPGLCGTIIQRSCSNSLGPINPAGTHKGCINAKVVVGVVLGTCFGTGLVIAGLAIWFLSRRRIIPCGDSSNIEMDALSSNCVFPYETEKDSSSVILFPNNTNELKDMTVAELLKATDNFSQSNIIGCGGFGLVYKATLANGTTLAIKKLSNETGFMEREFKAEVEVLSTAQHENLVSLQGYCFHEGGFRLLIYSYMENGSLDYWLHEKPDGPTRLDWPTRLKILIGSSNGLAYMHQICEPHIVHRDIKSSNILLDETFEPHLADFGLSRLILPYETHVTTELVGTLGYIPPEYGQAWVATLRGDMYSFGIVMLEVLTGRRPVEAFRPKMARELVGWVQQMRKEGKQEVIFDSVLRGKRFDEEMGQVLDVACLCVNQNPFKRPKIQEVVDCLKNVGSPRNENKG